MDNDGLRPWARWMIEHRMVWVLYTLNCTIAPLVIAVAAVLDYAREDGAEHHRALRDAAKRARTRRGS